MKYIIGLLIGMNAYATEFNYGDKVVDITACNVKQSFHNICGRHGYVVAQTENRVLVKFIFQGVDSYHVVVDSLNLKRVK